MALEGRGYQGSYKLVGGRSSLDIVNTLSWPESARAHDWLDPAGNVIDWAIALQIIDRTTAGSLQHQITSDTSMTARSLARIRVQRAAIQRVLAPLTQGKRPEQSAVEALNGLLVLCHPFRHIDPRRLEWTWEPPLRLDEGSRTNQGPDWLASDLCRMPKSPRRDRLLGGYRKLCQASLRCRVQPQHLPRLRQEALS